MKRIILVALGLSLTACGTTGLFGSSDQYEKRAEQERERQEKNVSTALDKAPKWMIDLPKSKSAVYANGTAVSTDLAMSINKAKTIAYGKVCMSAGGKVDQQTKIYRLDNETSGTEHSEMAIRSMCPGVDISGVEVVETKLVQEGTRFRSYVLIALPTGEANAIQTLKSQRELRQKAETRSQQAFKELDALNAQPAQPKAAPVEQPKVPVPPAAGVEDAQVKPVYRGKITDL